MNYTFFYQKFGQHVEDLRKKKGLTQEELAVKAGLHRAYFLGYRKWEEYLY